MIVAGAQVALRPVREDDGEFLFRVYASTRAEELAPVPWSSEQKDVFLRQQFQAQDGEYRRTYVGASFDIIVVDADSAGRMYVNRGHRDIRVVDIALLTEFRGRGIGSALLRSLLDEAREAQTSVSIHVEVHNPARGLYDRLGFRPVAEHGIYVLMEATPEPLGAPGFGLRQEACPGS